MFNLTPCRGSAGASEDNRAANLSSKELRYLDERLEAAKQEILMQLQESHAGGFENFDEQVLARLNSMRLRQLCCRLSDSSLTRVVFGADGSGARGAVLGAGSSAQRS